MFAYCGALYRHWDAAIVDMRPVTLCLSNIDSLKAESKRRRWVGRRQHHYCGTGTKSDVSDCRVLR